MDRISSNVKLLNLSHLPLYEALLLAHLNTPGEYIRRLHLLHKLVWTFHMHVIYPELYIKKKIKFKRNYYFSKKQNISLIIFVGNTYMLE